jgi:amidase
MARNIADLALFLDTMAGLCPHDPMTFDAPAVSFAEAVRNARPPKRIAYTDTFGGVVPVDAETREICGKAVRRFSELGSTVEDAHPDVSNIGEAFLALRSQHFVVDRELQLQQHRELIKQDIIWNTERGLNQTPSKIAWAERERSAFVKRMVAFWQTYDLMITPGAATPAFDVNLRFPPVIDGVKQENYMAASLMTSAITVTSSPAVAIPCGFDRFGRPVGLQIVAPPRGEAAALAAAALFERLTGLDKQLPIEPRAGTVPSPLEGEG